LDLYSSETFRTINPIRTTRTRGRGRGGCLLTEEPTKFEEANTEECWRRAMDEELGSIRDNNTWKLVDLPNNHKAIGLKWVYKAGWLASLTTRALTLSPPVRGPPLFHRPPPLLLRALPLFLRPGPGHGYKLRSRRVFSPPRPLLVLTLEHTTKIQNRRRR
jgi:hypothetical protein